MPHQSWEARAQVKREQLSTLVPPEWKLDNVPSVSQCSNAIGWGRVFLTDEEALITETSARNILANIHAQVWSAEGVLQAFCHRAAVAHQLTNCLSEILFNEALATARELDRQFRSTGTLTGPLHGLPMSFMDRYRLEGSETSAGFVSWLGPKETLESESLLVAHLRKLGAIPFCKTIVPQSMMLASTENNIFGSTLNPYGRNLSAGGAAGGEGALLAMKGSPFGWVTEIAGSARIPAAFNGLFALRVCTGRLPTLGIASSSSALPVCGITPAMITSDLVSLQHVARLTLGSNAYQEDSQWLDLPWREMKFSQQFQARPTFAILKHDQHVQTHPPVQRALDIVSKALTAQGYEVIQWDPPRHHAAVQTLFRIIGADGGSEIRREIKASGESPVKQLEAWFSESESSSRISVEEFWSLCSERTKYNLLYHKYWKQSKMRTTSKRQVDGVIMPVTADAAAYENGLTYFGRSVFERITLS